MNDVTQILSKIQLGDRAAAEQLLPLVYEELRRLASHRLAQEQPGQTLQATALVHEAYLRLVDGEQSDCWNGRAHFFAAAAESMRRILVDLARYKQSQRHGGGRCRREFHNDLSLVDQDCFESHRILEVHEALAALETESPREAELVKLRFFAGMTLQEAAVVLDVSLPTVKRDWAAARVWLYRWLSAS